MQRYTVNFRAPNVATRRLLVPFLSSSTVGKFATELQVRLSRVGITADAKAIVFHLEDANGPVIDSEDELQNVIIDPRAEQIFASVPVAVGQGESSRNVVVPNGGGSSDVINFLVS